MNRRSRGECDLTDRRTHRPNYVTLAVHVHRGLITDVGIWAYTCYYCWSIPCHGLNAAPCVCDFWHCHPYVLQHFIKVLIFDFSSQSCKFWYQDVHTYVHCISGSPPEIFLFVFLYFCQDVYLDVYCTFQS